jgi:GNAT superfamily N-acetyltransferase
MKPESLSLSGDAEAIHRELRTEYLGQLVAPMDDMWISFADGAAAHALSVADELGGCCSVDAEGQLLRFYVQPRFAQHSVALLSLALEELEIRHMMVATLDPNALSTALDLARKVESHTLLYASVTEPEGPGLDNLVLAELGDHQRIVDFQAQAVGMPLAFLEPYARERLELQELVLHERDGQLLCVGELRRDQQQAGVAQLGLIVHAQERGKGIGTRMFSSLVTRSREQGLVPYCSTELTNQGARRAIERAGFRAQHRMLRVEFAAGAVG